MIMLVNFGEIAPSCLGSEVGLRNCRLTADDGFLTITISRLEHAVLR